MTSTITDQSDQPAKMGGGIQNGTGSWPDPPPRVYPERTKRCGGNGLVTRLVNEVHGFYK